MAKTIVPSHRTFQQSAAGLHGHREPVALVSHLLSGLQTVKKHLERIYAVLHVTNRTEAALKANDMLRHNGEK